METQCLIRKVQFRGLRSDKKAEFICINDDFFCKRNDENGLLVQTLNKKTRRNLLFQAGLDETGINEEFLFPCKYHLIKYKKESNSYFI